MVKDYTKKITHQDYRNPDKLKKYYHRVKKIIHSKPKIYKKTKYSKKDYKLIDDDFIVTRTGSMATPVTGGGVSLMFVLGLLLIPTSKPLSEAGWFIVILCSILTVFFIIYGISMPKKEHILNRRDGLITMTGFLWQPNITMDFNKAEFAYSTGGENAVGGFMLQVIRPNKWQTFDLFTVFGGDCYEDMSFIVWYMDRNRPLPPEEAFDEFRQADYERRKAAGFPKPLYRSNIATPEATKEQRAERKRIGGW